MYTVFTVHIIVLIFYRILPPRTFMYSTHHLILSFFTFYSLALPICPLVNTNGIPYVCAAFCDSVYLCDGPDDDHSIGRNMLSI